MADPEVEKVVNIQHNDLKHGQNVRQEIHQIIQNTRNFTGARLEVNVHEQRNQDLSLLVRGRKRSVEIACNLILRRLKRTFTGDDLPNEVERLTTENLRMHDQKDASRRMFACANCDFIWWRYVLQYKEVSCCNRCHVRYKAIPRDEEYGFATYNCPNCGNRFVGWGQRGVTSPCYECGSQVFPDTFGQQAGRRGRGRRHACSACNNGQINPCPAYRKVIRGSEVHHSSGSTAETFLTQMSMMTVTD